jgi:thermostable 8-oxoguanine DNA glycosylase
MIDPIHFTDYELDKYRLEEYILFCIAAAGKNAVTTSKNLERLLNHMHEVFNIEGLRPFDCIRAMGNMMLPETMKSFGFGCYNLKAAGFEWIAKSNLDLKTCSVDELEACPGIGLKTSRFFVLHTRRDSWCACLDTHILRWLGRLGYPNIPKQTPTSKKEYKRIEQYFLDICKERNEQPAVLDLFVWNEERDRLRNREAVLV